MYWFIIAFIIKTFKATKKLNMKWLKKWNDQYETIAISRWQQLTVLMSESLNYSLNPFVQTADSFRNKASEWIIDSLD